MPVRVLLVDDDAEFRDALQQTLTDAGFSVRIAADGSEALKVLNEAHDSIDVAIIDLNLPEVSGFEVIGAITRRKTVMRVFATTGIYRETYLEVAQHMGAHIAIRKPANLADLKEWIPAIRSILKAEGEMGFVTGALS
jgi:DNA-binding response OmpR family regulator